MMEGPSQLVRLVRVVQLVNLIETENLSVLMMKGRPHSIHTTRSSRATGESASHYRHLGFERRYDEGKAPVNSHDLYESCNW